MTPINLPFIARALFISIVSTKSKLFLAVDSTLSTVVIIGCWLFYRALPVEWHFSDRQGFEFPPTGNYYLRQKFHLFVVDFYATFRNGNKNR